MATKEVIDFVDDLDQRTPAAETVEFALDGVIYEVDLSEKNAAALRKYLGKFIEAGQRTGGRKRPPRRLTVQKRSA